MNNANESLEFTLSPITLENLYKVYMTYSDAVNKTDPLSDYFEFDYHKKLKSVISDNITDFNDFSNKLLSTIPIMISYIENNKTIYDYYSMVNKDYFEDHCRHLCKLIQISDFHCTTIYVSRKFTLPNDVTSKLSEMFYNLVRIKIMLYAGNDELTGGDLRFLRQRINFNNMIIGLVKQFETNISIVVYEADTGKYLSYFLKNKIEELIENLSDEFPEFYDYFRHNPKEFDSVVNPYTKNNYIEIIAEYINKTDVFRKLNIRMENTSIKLNSWKLTGVC